MNRTLITPDLEVIPVQFHSFFSGGAVYDSSCSNAAKVYFFEKGPGYFLKTAAKGTLKKEALMTDFFCRKGLSAEVLAYETQDCDWLLTTRILGEDCLFPMYLENPARLCDTTAELLRMIHCLDHTGCPIPDRTADYLQTARKNYTAQAYDATLFPDNWGYSSPEEAWNEVEKNGKYLRADTLLHGDYCLPNILLDNWKFSGFIDLDAAGVGDPHVDLFWGIWSLQFNLTTDRFRDRFLDAYGREAICEDAFRTVAAIEVFG